MSQSEKEETKKKLLKGAKKDENLSPLLSQELDENDEDDETEDDVDDASVNWNVSIDGLQEMEAFSFKFSVFTPGETSSGQVVVEFIVKRGVNSSLIEWLRKAVERKLTIEVSNHENERIEKWEMLAKPIAIAIDEFGQEINEPLCTTIQMSVRQITVV